MHRAAIAYSALLLALVLYLTAGQSSTDLAPRINPIERKDGSATTVLNLDGTVNERTSSFEDAARVVDDWAKRNLPAEHEFNDRA